MNYRGIKESTNKSPTSKLSSKLAEFTLGSRTPHNLSRSRVGKTPSKTTTTEQHRSKSVGRGLKTRSLTPSRNPNFSGVGNGGGDRYIPNRSASQFELGHYLLMNQNSQNESMLNGSTSAPCSPSKAEYQRKMRENLNGGVSNVNAASVGDLSDCRILAYQKGQAPQAPQGFQNQNHRVLYSVRAVPSSSCKKTLRHIPAAPERILDAPEILDDYYLNLLDWSSQNFVAVALLGSVYLWNAAAGTIQLLVELENTTDFVSSVSWAQDGNYLAVGFSTGATGLYDPSRENTLLRMMDGHTTRVGSLAWNSHLLTSGCRSGEIVHHDVRMPNHVIATLSGHTQEVCGLRWSGDGRHLASGGNDNLVQLWSAAMTGQGTDTVPLYTLSDHLAAVKALAWCPWQPSILASGGGCADRTIRFWNVNTGTCTMSTDAGSQVSALVWNSEYKELLSGHGYPSNQLTIWRYPSMTRVQELTGHTQRILNAAASPCGEFVMSAGADESLRLWHCFKVDETQKKQQRQATSTRKDVGRSIAQTIR
uniref:WD repeat-containing protein 55 homolog n=1 Tax=Plectus sambesii TaxID=2011161 RepID=A0A914WJ39_9BILA